MSRQWKGMVLAAGKGTRLMPLTRLRAKPAVPFLGRPLIHNSLDLLRSAGIEEMVINLHHLPETVRAAVDGYPAAIDFSEEPAIQGTGGALSRARKKLRGGPVVLVNGKVYFEQDLNPVLEFHRSSGGPATLVVVPYSPDCPFNPVLADSEHRIRVFARDRSALPPNLTPWVFTGIHLLEPEIVESIPEGPCDIVMDVYLKLIERDIPVRIFPSREYWCECSTPQRYLKNSLEVLRRKSLPFIGPEQTASRCFESVVGEGVEIPASTRVEQSLIWPGIRLGRDSSFKRVVLAGDLGRLPDKWHLEDAIVVPSEQEDPDAIRLFPTRKISVWPLE